MEPINLDFRGVWPDQSRVMKMLDCSEDNPTFPTLVHLFEQSCHLCEKLLKPVGRWKFEQKTFSEPTCGFEIKRGFTFISVGGGLEAGADDYFSQGEYMKAMMLHAIADDCLFQMERIVHAGVSRWCQRCRLKVASRLEAGNDFDALTLKNVIHQCDLPKEWGIQVTRGGMLVPEKSMCFIYTFKTKGDGWEHDCRQCSKKDCHLRNLWLDERKVLK